MAQKLLRRLAVFTGFSRDDCADFPTVSTLLAAIRSEQSEHQNQAIKCLYSRFEPIAYAEARRFKKGHAEAADPMNNVLISLYELIRERKLNFLTEDEMSKYVRKALFYQFRRAWVQQGRVDYYGDSAGLTAVETNAFDTAFDRMADADRVQLALVNSTDQCREKLLLRQEGYSYQEIGTRLHLSSEAVKNAVFRCRERLKKLFGEAVSYSPKIQEKDR